MIIKLKRMASGRVVKTEFGNKIEEVLVDAGVSDAEKGKVSLCFRGQNHAGIVELSKDEVKKLFKTMEGQKTINKKKRSKKRAKKKVKVVKIVRV